MAGCGTLFMPAGLLLHCHQPLGFPTGSMQIRVAKATMKRYQPETSTKSAQARYNKAKKQLEKLQKQLHTFDLKHGVKLSTECVAAFVIFNCEDSKRYCVADYAGSDTYWGKLTQVCNHATGCVHVCVSHHHVCDGCCFSVGGLLFIPRSSTCPANAVAVWYEPHAHHGASRARAQRHHLGELGDRAQHTRMSPGDDVLRHVPAAAWVHHRAGCGRGTATLPFRPTLCR
jgi:hypothetical protein